MNQSRKQPSGSCRFKSASPAVIFIASSNTFFIYNFIAITSTMILMFFSVTSNMTIGVS